VILISTAHDEYKGIDFSSFKSQVVDTRHAAQGSSGLVHQA
jgi:UDP-N-acetyl-D-mannosaminuronate dehydrogenase